MKGLMGLLASAVLAFTVFAEGGALPKTKYPPLNETLFQMYFKKVEPSQLKGNVFDWVRKECFLVTAGSPASYNSMTAGWGGFGVLWGRDVASIYVRNTRYTYEFLEKEPYFTLSFYAAFATGDVVLSVSDGSSTRALTYQASSSYNVWSEVTVGFTLANPVSNLTITLAPSQAFNYEDRKFGLNFDDIVLTTGGGGQEIDLGSVGKEYRWAELPATPADMTNRKIHTFWSTTVSTKQHLRNYTYCYDTERHCPLWIAHPQHACYEEGRRTRPKTEPWAADPNMTQAEQAIIWIWPGDNRDKYVVSESPLYRWGRGHMLASGYRGCGDENNPAEINVQTFYSCNIAPQGGKVFSSLWQQAEWRIQDKYVCADTLYCVSGAHFDEGAIAAYDGSWVNTNAQTRGHIDESKPCEVPTHYYKLILRTRNGNTGKAIQDCSASELIAVGFWFENGDGTDDRGAAKTTLDASYLKSVAWIEQQTGFTFFPDVPPSVKQQCNPSDWKFF